MKVLNSWNILNILLEFLLLDLFLEKNSDIIIFIPKTRDKEGQEGTTRDNEGQRGIKM